MPELSTESAAADATLVALLQWLRAQDYRFVTPTPLTHSRVLARADRASPRSLRDVFGWNLPFAATDITPHVLDWLHRADALHEQAGSLRSALRVSSLGDTLYLHSAYPTDAGDAVFFGPDTYRYCHFIEQELKQAGPLPAHMQLADIGCGSGAGGIFAARLLRQPVVQLTDINPAALRLARINAAAAGVEVQTVQSDVLAQVSGALDLLIANPPYLNDDRQRAYRHGGGALGFDLSLRIAQESLARLRSGGRLLLYTGVAIVNGEDPFLHALRPLLAQSDCEWSYRELDPDVFGEELERPCYRAADRIAVVGLVAIKS